MNMFVVVETTKKGELAHMSSYARFSAEEYRNLLIEKLDRDPESLRIDLVSEPLVAGGELLQYQLNREAWEAGGKRPFYKQKEDHNE